MTGSKWKTYPEYREIELNYISAVPVHWKTIKLGRMSQIVKRTGYENEQLLSVYLDRGVIPYSEGGGLVHKPSSDLDSYQLVTPGDFVLNNQQAHRGSVGISSVRGIVSPAYHILEISEMMDSDYANLFLRSKFMAGEYMICSRGVGSIQRQIHMYSLQQVEVLIPPIDEQKAIARFANEIEKYVSELTANHSTINRGNNESLLFSIIDLIQEYREALITAAVTGKIDVRGLR